MGCEYCLNRHGKFNPSKHVGGDKWIEWLNRLELRDDLPITLQGGEPTMHPDFYKIVNGIHNDKHIDLLTNGEFDEMTFMTRIPPERMKRDAKYASIRFSYHPGYTHLTTLLQKVYMMQRRGYSVGIWAVDHPAHATHVRDAQKRGQDWGLDFRLKEFLGEWEGTLYGTYKYDGCFDNNNMCRKSCRTSELLVGPRGHVYNCHSTLYSSHTPYSHISKLNADEIRKWRVCDRYGTCNPCDVKVKTNRFQQYGHTSVEIRDVR